MAFALYISEKHVNWIRVLLLGVFSLVAMFFSFFLFWNFPDKDYLRPIFSVFGFTWEIGTLFFAIQLKTAVVKRSPLMLGWALGYVFFVGISTLGGIGFNLATSGNQTAMQSDQRKVQQASSSSDDLYRKSLMDNITLAENDVTTYTNMLPQIPPDNLSRIRQVTGWKNDAAAKYATAVAQLKKYDEEQITKKTEVIAVAATHEENIDIFAALGNLLGLGNGDVVRKMFFIVIVIVIQIIVLISSPIIGEKEQHMDFNKNLMRFIDAMFEDGRGKQLASPYRVAKKLNIDSRERDRYVDLLMSLEYRGEAILKQSRGGTSTAYDQTTFKKIVTWLLEHSPAIGDAEEGNEV